MDHTLEDLINQESKLALSAEEKYGEYFNHAVDMVTLLNNVAQTIDKPDHFLFVAFLSQVKTHITQALLSAIRLHHVQAGMNARQVLEASVWAAYAMAFTDLSLFQVQSEKRIEVPDRLVHARNKWLETNYPDISEVIVRLKKKINSTVAHANISYAFQTFDSDIEGSSGFNTTYFDAEDDYTVKMDLLMISNLAMGMLQLFTKVDMVEKVFRVHPSFPARFRTLCEQQDRLRADIQTHERFPKPATSQE